MPSASVSVAELETISVSACSVSYQSRIDSINRKALGTIYQDLSTRHIILPPPAAL